ncbi:hypothetical protein [Actinoalloteichus hymeniacidonis]|uniref:Uncharacterized protein n=1 Tax=Actinoalloteichus hymeniacidonis TaxID=340345 RepID=A0AAC9HLY1_9PSEU|nr:hypothetical protein [Actinoalloteichus hymeniacidonis]AOS61554.1 hypothetical protein TL08_03610 [Actinoalloteichus hymeniacidonis]MBB5910437.1 hypothetical protein [Actinoalloteichus hymeniacidonis]
MSELPADTAGEPLLIDQVAAPEAGLILQRHKVFVDAGELLPIDGDRAIALCGAGVLFGPPPAEVEPGIPSTHVEDCHDCRAIHLGEVDPPASDDAVRWFVRRSGEVQVHIVPADGVTATRLVALCGTTFRLGDGLERLVPGDGAPCVACLIGSLSVPATPLRYRCDVVPLGLLVFRSERRPRRAYR